ncbi:hypothetical protein [Candidatus Poriferisocius sp.]|uniref:hypothetical protein n=1 Tax=Candidatus Poriferisocius sp. TaxID=3101276 RepID=UPI003B5295CC
MPKLTVNLGDIGAGFPESTVRIYPVWSEDAHRLGQGFADADGTTWLPDPELAVPDSTGTVVFDIPASDDIGGAFYTLAVDGGPTWVGIEMPATDAVFTRALISGAPLPPFEGFRPSDLAADNNPVVGWGIVVADGDQWTFQLQGSGGGGITEVRPTDLDATNAPAVGDTITVGDSNEFSFSPVPISGYVYHQSHELAFTPVTSEQPSAKAWTVTVMDDTIDGGIVAGLDFITDYQGSLIVDVDTTASYSITNRIEHHFADGTMIEADRSIEYRIPQGGTFTVPMVAFSARSQIELGSYTDPAGNTITITEALLKQPVRIVHKIVLARTNNQAFKLEAASMANGRVTWTQLSAVVPNPGQGPPGVDGADGPYDVEIYIDSATAPTAAPTGGTVDVATATVLTAPTGWTIDAPSTITDNLYVSRARIRPKTETGTVVPTWGHPFEIGAHGATGAPGAPGKPGTDATVTKAAVYPITAQIIKGSRSVTVTANAADQTLTLTTPDVAPTDIYPGVAQIMQGSTTITITPDNDAETLTLTIPNEAIGRAQLSASQQLPLELGTKGQKLVIGETVGVKHTAWVDDDSAVTQEEVYRENKKILKTTDDTVTITPDDSGSTLTLKAEPTQAQIYDLAKAIFTPANNDVIFTDDDTEHTTTIGIIREIVETDWVNLPVGFGFRVGTIVPRSRLWYICYVATQKGGTGPDNDPDHFEVITTWAGNYSDSRYYLTGTQTLYKNRIATALEAIGPSDVAPDADGSKWHLDGEEISKAAVYAQNKTIIKHGGGIVVAPDDDDETLTISADLDPEHIYDEIASIVEAGTGIAVTPDASREKVNIAANPTKATEYPVVKQMPKAGNNVKITFDDTSKEWVTDVRLPDEAAPRVYALDSRDVRQVLPPYSYSITSEGFNLTPGTRFMEPGPVSYNGYDGSRPGFERDTTNSSNNYNGQRFTNKKAGTTTRTLHVASEITLANERQYSSAETLTMRVYVGGYFKNGNAADGQVIYTKVWNFTGGYQDAFHYDFDLTLSQRGRSGEHDWWRCDYLWTTGSGEVVAGQIQAAKHTVSLPALGSVPTQDFTHNTTNDLDEIQDWIPRELKPQISSVSRVMTWTVKAPDTTGTNAPNESDKSDVLLPTVDSSTPFLRAAQDLSRLKLQFTGGADADGGDVYLCTRIQGFPPTVLANTSVSSAWTIDFTAQGVMALQDYYLIDPTGNGIAAQAASWNANPGGPKINSVIDGIFHTAHLVAGINYTPEVTSEISIDDAELTEAAEAGLLHVIRIYSGNTVAELPLRGIPRPVPFGSGSTKRQQIGVGRVKIDAQGTGGNQTLIWVSPYRDIHGLHFSILGSTGNTQQCYVSGCEIEYARYLV